MMLSLPTWMVIGATRVDAESDGEEVEYDEVNVMDVHKTRTPITTSTSHATLGHEQPCIFFSHLQRQKIMPATARREGRSPRFIPSFHN